jgi:hypothetical protein
VFVATTSVALLGALSEPDFIPGSALKSIVYNADAWVTMKGPLRNAVATLAGLLACGLPLWPIPYSEVSMPGNPPPWVWLLLGSVAGVIAGYLIRSGVVAPVLSIAFGFVSAVLLRVVRDTAIDPTSHNLWPFEVVIAGFFGLLAGAIGLCVARGAQRATRGLVGH